ncbi:SDR family NAD(P)-dependent oxidoreductase [Streptomyces sp. NPDC039022]|uniref:type I polyketide synthase n=1 Tax=unclassified Streptomyces TaxID=2593676 RepID=UPI0033C50AC2
MPADSRAPRPEPIAIVGMACRFPGAIATPGALWRALAAGRDLITEVPEDRFDAARFVADGRHPGKSYTAAGGFLDDIKGFDGSFFSHISPREAQWLDPQQRILLEMAVEALDDSGTDAASLAGSDTAVYVGVSSHDYIDLQTCLPQDNSPYAIAGSAAANTANRISHLLDLHGPSLALDTACSSALTAVHAGCEQLRSGRSHAVLAGGINVLISPYVYAGFAAASMLSPTGRCRTFSAQADGYVRAEGGGLVMLKRLSSALADGDRVHAVIRADGINNDGVTPGLAVPNAHAQETLLREVYEGAGISPDDLVYLEAHGTGTPVGDPVECRAIGRALSSRRRNGALPIGSVKTNMGHLEAASGMAGLFKALLVLRERTAPATLHCEPFSDAIDFDALNLRPTALPHPLEVSPNSVVGVNSFGFGGANAHLILGAPPQARPSSPASGALAPPAAHRPSAHPVIVSGAGPTALSAAAERLATYLAKARPGEEEDEGEHARRGRLLYDVAYTTCRRRSHHRHRAVVLATDTDRAATALRTIARGEQPLPGSAVSEQTPHGRVVFAFSGNGTQWAGMGADLLATEPAFARAVDEVDEVLAPRLGWSVREELSAPPSQWRLRSTEIAQPLLFAVQMGQVAVLERVYGIRPDAVAGHSVGETAAACTAGALDLRQAAEVVLARSQAQAATAGRGRMAAIGLSEQEARAALAFYDGALEIAGVNSDRDVTVSGDADALRRLGEELAAEQRFFRLLDIDHAFHSRSMDSVEKPLRAALAALRPSPVALSMASSVNGAPLRGRELDAEYWWRNVRGPVLFGRAVQTLRAEGGDVFVEIGPHPVLTGYLRRLTADSAAPVAVVPTCAQGSDGPEALRTAAARVLAAGARPRWDAFFPYRGAVADLPPYPWQREECWRGESHWWNGTHAGNDMPVDDSHPLLGARLADIDPVWSGPLEPARLPWLADHRVDGEAVLPAAAYVDIALAVAHRQFDAPVEITSLDISRALVLPDDADGGCVRMQTSLGEEGHAVRIASRATPRAPWLTHARGRVRALLARTPRPVDTAEVLRRASAHWTAQEHYARAARNGLPYGPAFQVVSRLDHGPHEALASYHCELPADGYRVHPALLDGALQAGAPLLADLDNGSGPFLPVGIDRVRLWSRPRADGFVHVRGRELGAHEACWDITVTDPDGTVAMEMTGCRLRRYAGGARRHPRHLVPGLRALPRPHTHIGTSPLPTPAELREATASGTHTGYGPPPAGPAVQRGEDGFTACFEELSAHFAARALACFVTRDAPFTTDDLVAAGVRAKYTPLCELLLSLASRWQLAGREEGDDGRPRWRLSGAPRTEALLQAAVGRFPGQVMSVALFARCGMRAPEVLRGETEAVELLFHEADQHLVEHFYSHYPALRTDHRRAAAVVRALVARWPADRPLRVLEVGAGTGATTARLLPLLPAERTQYVFSDVSPAFFARAQGRFAAYDFLTYRSLDLDRDPADQGFEEAGFDLVIATNVLHATTDLPATLNRISGLLADGGQLMAVEIHDAESLALCFGLLDSFWTYTDRGLRTGSPLLPARAWPPLLRDSGFTDVARLNEDADEEDSSAASNHSLLLARRPERAAPVTGPPPYAADGHWLLVAERPEAALVQRLADLLAGITDGSVPVIAPGEVSAHLPRIAPDHVHEPRLVLLLDQDTPSAAEPEAVLDQALKRLDALRDIAAACASLPEQARPALFLVTRPSGAFPAPEVPEAPGDAVAWGAARTLANEQPRLTVRRISLHRGDDPAQDALRLAHELLDPDDEDELLLTPNGRFAARLVNPPPGAPDDEGNPVPRVLRVDVPGRRHRLSWHLAPPRRPGPGEVAITVEAAALNYRDVMMAIGIYPPGGEAITPDGIALGLECAGVVTEVGSDDTGFAPGDRVYAIADHCLGTHVVARADRTGAIPQDMTFTEAATLPVVFLTVQHSLEHLARLADGETVLIHGAAGGVGLAALQYARRQGSRVIATAGTPAKRNLLRLMGAHHVLDSRNLHFADRIAELTDGEGVDVVLNSIAGEAIPRSLEQLRPGGRFVELGKRDIYAGTPLSLRPFRNNLTYFGVDAHQLLTHRLGSVRSTFADMARRITAGHYRPLPHQVWPATQVDEAFQAMRRSRHLGKVVVSFDSVPPLDRPAATPRPDAEGTYLITGGLGGLGAATALHLARRGARHLVLVGRRGLRTPGAPELTAALDALGARTDVHAVDVTDPDAVAGLLKSVDASGHPLRGVLHGAMVLDDGTLADLSDGQLRDVVAPKLLGGLLLDSATRGRALDFFAVYSSGAATVGNLQQANYGAANLYLEALTRCRRSAGEPSLALAYGPVSDAGYVAREHLTDAMTARGWLPITTNEALDALDEHLARGTDVVFIDRSDWRRVGQILPAVETPRFAAVTPDSHDGLPGDSPDDLRRRLLQADPGPARTLAAEALTEVLAKVLHRTPQSLGHDRPLEQFGVDSLMATEVAQAIRRRIGCDFSTLEITNAGDISTLAHRVLVRIGHPATDAATASTGGGTEDGAGTGAGSGTGTGGGTGSSAGGNGSRAVPVASAHPRTTGPQR